MLSGKWCSCSIQTCSVANKSISFVESKSHEGRFGLGNGTDPSSETLSWWIYEISYLDSEDLDMIPMGKRFYNSNDKSIWQDKKGLTRCIAWYLCKLMGESWNIPDHRQICGGKEGCLFFFTHHTTEPVLRLQVPR